MNLYFKSMKMHLKSELEYKTSFIISFISQILVFFTYYFIILALFSKFDNISGFTIYEVLLTFGIVQFGFSMNEVLCRGLDKFDELIIDGSFDRLLVRPKNILLQVLCTKSDFVKLSRVIQSLIVLCIAICNLDISWDIYKVITLLLMLISSIIVFFSLFLIMASYCFYTVQGLEIRNLFTDGGKNIAQYPIGVFKKVIMFILTFIIPFGFVNYYPLLYVLGRVDNKLYMLSPLIVIIYTIPAFLSFKVGMKKYDSAGS